MRPRLPEIAGFALVLTAAAATLAQDAPGELVVLVGGEFHTGTGAVLRDGAVFVRGGRIESVGEGVSVPASARRIDLAGAIVTPGFVDADGSLPIADSERFPRRSGVDLRAADAVNRHDARYATARSQGVTGFVVTGDARGNFPGIAAVVVGATPAVVVEPDGPLVVTLATPDVSGGVWGAQRLAEVRGVFVSARDRRDALERWRRDVQRYEERRAAEEPIAIERLLLPPDLLEEMTGWTPERRAAWREGALKSAGREKDWTKPKDLAKPPSRPGPDPALDLVLTAMDAASGRRTIVRTQGEGDVAAALALAREFGLTLTVAGGEGLAAQAKELLRAKAGVIVTDAADTAFRGDGPLTERGPGLVARLVAAGLHPALGSSGLGASARFLRLLAAAEIGEGLSSEDALRAVTSWPAEAAGVADSVGAIAAGARADLVVWDGDPFAAASKPRLVMVGGEIVLGAAR